MLYMDPDYYMVELRYEIVCQDKTTSVSIQFNWG